MEVIEIFEDSDTDWDEDLGADATHTYEVTKRQCERCGEVEIHSHYLGTRPRER